MATFTSEKLIADVRRRALLPNATGLGSSDTDILAYLNDALQMYIAPLLLSVGGEYLVDYEDVTTTVGTAKYQIPSRSLGNKLRDVLFLCGERYISLQQTEPERVSDYTTSNGEPQAFYVEGSSIILVPAPDRATTLRLKYYRRPNELVLASTVGLVDSSLLNGGTGLYDVTASVVDISTFANLPVDIVGGKSSFGCKVKDTTTGVSSTGILSFAPDVTGITAVAAGDYVCLADTSPVAQIPQELYPLLAQTAALEIAEALNNPRSGEILKRREIMKNQLMPLITPRSEGTGRVIINPNAVGMSRYTRYHGW